MKKYLLKFLKTIYRLSGLKTFLESESVIDLELHPLEGDRAIEYPWCFSPAVNKKNLKILDIGPVQSPLTGFAWRYGHDVSSVDLRDIGIHLKIDLVFINKMLQIVTLNLNILT